MSATVGKRLEDVFRELGLVPDRAHLTDLYIELEDRTVEVHWCNEEGPLMGMATYSLDLAVDQVKETPVYTEVFEGGAWRDVGYTTDGGSVFVAPLPGL